MILGGILSFFFFLRFYLFLERGEGREKELERNIMCDCLLHAPTWGPGPKPRHVPWLGIQPVTLQDGTQSTELHQSGLDRILLLLRALLGQLGKLNQFWRLNNGSGNESLFISWFWWLYRGSVEMSCLWVIYITLCSFVGAYSFWGCGKKFIWTVLRAFLWVWDYI